MKNTNLPYGFLDKSLHKLAFNSKILQQIFNDIEHTLYVKKYQEIEIIKPIFITSLPRAGTSILLNIINTAQHSASYTYREMPFLFNPLLWNKISFSFHRRYQLKERSHGDGLKVNVDSPEAFDEVFWMKYYSDKYEQNSIKLWDDMETDKFFLKKYREQIKKILLLKRNTIKKEDNRYISKNNANIARISLIQNAFNDAIIVVPFREPLEQAISLMRQHQKFIKKHKDDDFTYKYMKDLGHYEFGLLHKAIEFKSFHFYKSIYSPNNVNYWLAYWCCAFEELLSKQNIKFISFENLCGSNENKLTTLFNELSLKVENKCIENSLSLLKPPPSKRQINFEFSTELKSTAYGIYTELQKLSVI